MLTTQLGGNVEETPRYRALELSGEILATDEHF